MTTADDLMDLLLRDQTAVVVGGAKGLGRAIAEGFAAEGAQLALVDVDAAVQEAAEVIAAEYEVAVHAYAADITDEAAMLSVAAETGPVEHVVHAAAVGSGKFGFPFLECPPSVWARVLEVNVIGAVHVAHAFAPAMIEARRGTFLFIASVAGQIGSQTDPPYSASKAALINFAQCVAKDLAPHNIRVNTICPGMIKTALNKSVWQAWHDRQPPELQQDYETWAAAKIKQVVPLNRWQEPRDIADAALFLASERGQNITGQTINVDGGFVMHW